MRSTFRWAGLAAAAIMLAAAPAAMAADAADCPNGGVVRFGVEPYDTSAKLVPIYDHIGKALADKIGCQVQIYVTTNYNAEIEAVAPRPALPAVAGYLGGLLAQTCR